MKQEGIDMENLDIDIDIRRDFHDMIMETKFGVMDFVTSCVGMTILAWSAAIKFEPNITIPERLITAFIPFVFPWLYLYLWYVSKDEKAMHEVLTNL